MTTETPQKIPAKIDRARSMRTEIRHPKALGGDPIRTFRPTFSLSEMVINNREADPHQVAVKRKPPWLKAKVPGGEGFKRLKRNVDTHNLYTVCEEAACPNMGECWGTRRRHDHDPGRHVHALLRLLQRAKRAPARA